MTDAAHYRGLVRSVIEDQPWLVAMDVLVPAARMAESLLELGASSVFALGASRGMGELPDPERVPQLALDNRGDDMMSAVRSAQNLLADLPSTAREIIAAWDPGREARVLATLFSDGRTVADRPVYAARPTSWQALEDKIRIDAFWDEAGVERAPSVVVRPLLEDLLAASKAIDCGSGTVWAGDNRDGFNGGAHAVRWIRDPGCRERPSADTEEAVRFFANNADRVRVMPFLEGTPCSIHGIVQPQRTLAQRP